MRTDGLPSRPAVARLIALTSRMPASIAALNQFPNCLIGSGLRSLRRRPFFGVLVARGGRISRDFHQDNKSTAQRCAARKLSCLSPGSLGSIGKRDLLLEAFATANA